MRTGHDGGGVDEAANVTVAGVSAGCAAPRSPPTRR